MKVKVLTTNIMIDYKKVEKGEIIDLSDKIAKQFINANLVEAVTETKKAKE